MTISSSRLSLVLVKAVCSFSEGVSLSLSMQPPNLMTQEVMTLLDFLDCWLFPQQFNPPSCPSLCSRYFYSGRDRQLFCCGTFIGPLLAGTCSPLKGPNALTHWQTTHCLWVLSAGRAALRLGYERKFVILLRTIAGCSKFQTLKPTGSHSKGLFIDSCLLVQLRSRNVVSTCAFSACHCVCVSVKCCVHVLGCTVGKGSQMWKLSEEGSCWWLAERLGPFVVLACVINVISCAWRTLYKIFYIIYLTRSHRGHKALQQLWDNGKSNIRVNPVLWEISLIKSVVYLYQVAHGLEFDLEDEDWDTC